MISKIDLKKYHNAIVVCKTEDELKKWISENNINLDFVYKLSKNERLLRLITKDIEITYNVMFEQKVKSVEEYTKKNPDNPIYRKEYMFYATAKELKNDCVLLRCLQKGFGAGYSFIIGVTDGEHKKELVDYYANCPCVIQ